MKKLFFILLVNTNLTFAQLSEEQSINARRFEHNYARKIDLQDTLINGVLLTFSHSTNFDCIHMTDTSGVIHLVDVRGRENTVGYIKFFKDELTIAVFEVRFAGSGNPPFYLSVNKFNGELKWLLQKPE